MKSLVWLKIKFYIVNVMIVFKINAISARVKITKLFNVH